MECLLSDITFITAGSKEAHFLKRITNACVKTKKMQPAIIQLNILHTKRLWLREINPAVYKTLFTTANNHQIMEVLGLQTAYELETERLRYQQGVTTFNQSFKNFQLVHKVTQRIIGWCGFHTWMLYHHRAEIGYEIMEESFKGQGLMTEALQPIIAWGFEQMALNRVEALIEPGNQPSLKLVQRLGFTKEGLLRKHYYKDQVFEDSVIYALLKEDYYQLKDQWTG
jgi:[ribosomal protein S5]-alanine N-acetyltransferase